MPNFVRVQVSREKNTNTWNWNGVENIINFQTLYEQEIDQRPTEMIDDEATKEKLRKKKKKKDLKA